MNQEVAISVIMPVYNVELYLNESMDSIINQTFKNIEIICIDDGSTDSSSDILKRYKEEDSRIKIFTQENKGQGNARNRGISLAKGKYTYFMDADDILELNALETTYSIAENDNLDMVLFKLINYDDQTKKVSPLKYYDMKELRNIVHDNIFTYEDVKDIIFKVAVSPPAKLFKTNLIKNIQFPEKVIFEDNVFFMHAFLNAKRIRFYDEYLYYRRLRLNSTMTNYEHFSDSIIVSNMVFEVFKEYGLFEEFAQALYNRKILKVYSRYDVIEDRTLREDFYHKLKEDFSKHKEEYEKDQHFNEISDKAKQIFIEVIKSEDMDDFDFKMDYHNTKEKCERLINREMKLRRSFNKLKKDNNDLTKRYASIKKENKSLKKRKSEIENKKLVLEEELSELELEKQELIKENKELKKSNEHFKSTKAYKVWVKYASIKEKI